MKSVRMEILLLIVVLFVGVAANTTPLSYDKKNSIAGPIPYPVIYPRSIGAYDGWVRESSEFSNVGGSLNVVGTTLAVGDDAVRRQFRSVLQFNISIPPTAVIVNATLRIRRQGSFVGTNPFAALGLLRVEMRKPSFGTPALLITDFQAPTGVIGTVAVFNSVPVSGWYKAVLNTAARTYINRSGATQFRLRFTADDNNDSAANYINFFSGNYSVVGSRPTLEIKYYVP